MSSRTYETPKREFLVFYYKYRMRLVLAFLLPFLLSVVISFMPTPRYNASSTLVVRLGSEYVYQPETGAGSSGPASPIPFDRDQIYKAEVAILGSYDLHQEVVETVGLDRMYPLGETSRLHRLIEPARTFALEEIDEWMPDSDDSMLGQAATAIRGALSNGNDDSKSSDEERARKRLQLAVQRFDKQLNIILEKESAVIDVSFQHRDRDVAIEALNTLLKLYLEKRKTLYTETPRAATAQAEAEKTRRRAAAAQQAVENFKREHKLYSLDDQRTQLLAQREEVRKQMLSVSNPALDDKLNAVTAQLDELDAQERQYDALVHDQQMTNDEYTLYAHKLDEAQSYDSMERSRASSVRVVQEPSAPPEPKRLQSLIILAGFMVSLIFTVLVAAITEFSRSGFLTPERLERNLGVPILAALPLRK